MFDTVRPCAEENLEESTSASVVFRYRDYSEIQRKSISGNRELRATRRHDESHVVVGPFPRKPRGSLETVIEEEEAHGGQPSGLD